MPDKPQPRKLSPRQRAFLEGLLDHLLKLDLPNNQHFINLVKRELAESAEDGPEPGE